MKGFFRDFFLNKNLGQWSFILHRLTGVLLAIYLIPHILLNATGLLFGREFYDKLTSSVQTHYFHYLELAIILGVAFHLFNGLRIIFSEFLNMSRAHFKLLWYAAAATAIVAGYSLWVYLPKLLGHGG